MAPLQRRALIIGSGSCAKNIAENLFKKDVEVIVAVRDQTPALPFPEPPKGIRLEILTQTRLLKCHGSVEEFTVSMEQKGKRIERCVSHILVTEEDRRDPNFSDYGLIPSFHVQSLSQIMDLLDSPQTDSPVPEGKKVVFISGLLRESNPVIAEEVMASALRLQSEFNNQVYLLTGNLKVGDDGLEVLYRKTKDAGVIYAKLTPESTSDTLLINQDPDGHIRIEFYDEITGKPFRLTPDMTVVDETIIPFQDLLELTRILKLDTDEAGFAQSGNVHRFSVRTNRKGVIAAGPSRKALTARGHTTDASNAALCLAELMAETIPEPENKAEINRSKCVRCLTCYRLCPFKAICLDTKPRVMPNACEGCGICTAECPKGVINIEGLLGSDISDKIVKPDSIRENGAFIPFIVAFCCRRSAARARDLAIEAGHHLPLGLTIIELPCSGIISYDHIFSAFKKGADGIMVLTCHEGNCHSEKGNVYARQRAERVFELLMQMGFKKERLVIDSLAANMGMEFTEAAMYFEKQIMGMGPSKIKP